MFSKIRKFFKKDKKTPYNEALITNIMNASLDAYVTVDEDSKILEWSRSAEDIFLYTREEVLGQSITDLILPRRYVAQHRLGVKTFLRTGESKILRQRIEVTARNRNNIEFPVELTVMPIETDIGYIFTASLRDLTEKRKNEEKQQLLAQELNHRVKNIMSVIQSLAQHSFKTDPRLAIFVARLFAMSKAHNILVQNEWSSADINTLVTEGIQFYGGSDRFKIQGTSVYKLPASSAVSFSLLIHELTTNAIKYGALSNAEGYVEITWARLVNNTLIWAWQEFNGPPVVEPDKKGFGYKLITRSLTGIANVDIDFNPKGLKCTIKFDY